MIIIIIVIIIIIIIKPNSDRPSFVLSQNTSPITTQGDPAFDYVYELKLQETPGTHLNSPISTLELGSHMETSTTGQ